MGLNSIFTYQNVLFYRFSGQSYNKVSSIVGTFYEICLFDNNY